MPYERAVIRDRAKAAEHAEDFAAYYAYTLTDIGVIDITGDFSEGYREQRDFDYAVDAKLDKRKERRA